MLSSMRSGVNILGGCNRYSMILAGGLNAIKHHAPRNPTRGALVNYYHCTQPKYGQTQESSTSKTNRKTMSKAKLDMANKVKATQIVYKPVPLATVITLSRAATAPALGYFIFNGMYHEAIYCMTYVIASDILDKVVAVKTKQASPANAILDSISDKLITTTSAIAMYNMSILPIWLVKGLVLRDIIAVVFGSMLRYYGFSESPSFKKFFDFNNHPTLGYNPLIIERVHTGAVYAMIMLHLSLSESARSEYFYSLTTCQGSILLLTSIVLALRLSQLLERRFISRIFRRRS